jgi:type I restriction enzyme S subunit
MSFPRYPKYKDSGVEWLGEVPEGWEVRPPRKLADLQTGLTPPTAEIENYSDERGFPWVRPEDLDESGRPTQASKFLSEKGWKLARHVPAQSSLICCIGTIGKVGIVGETASTNQQLTASSFERNSRYGFYSLCAGREIMEVESTGNVLRILNTERLGRISIPSPPVEEANAIAAFLDRETAKIDALVAEQRRLMELLKEKRQAVISHAVTKGLNREAPMKDSGIEWLGEVPGHWGQTKLSRLSTRIGDGLHGTPQYVDESEHRFINGNNLAGGKIVFSETTRCVSEEEAEKHRIELNDYTLLLSINGTIGNLAFYHGETVMLGKSAAYINCNGELNREFLFWFLQSSHIARYFDFSVTGTTINNLSLESIRGLPVVLPPLKEQSAIVADLYELAGRFDTLTTEARRAIALLQERRTALISAAVTGQIDVRGLAGTSV